MHTFFVRPTALSLSCGEAPCACGTNGAPLAATNEMPAGAICKRRDVVTLGRKKGLQPRANERPAVSCCDELDGAAYVIWVK